MKKRVARKLVKTNLLNTKATSQKMEVIRKANIRNRHISRKPLTQNQKEEYEKFMKLFK